MLENLTLKLSKIFSSLTGKYRLSDSNIKDILRDIRKALIDADVSWEVVKLFLNNVRDKVIGMEITNKISPGEMFTKVVYDELVSIFVSKDPKEFVKNSLYYKKPSVLLLVGLQGVGKTTVTIKLAKWIKDVIGKSVSVVSCDIYRPAALDQLRYLSEKHNINFCNIDSTNIIEILKNAITVSNEFDFLIVDTAGRLHVDDYMMNEIKVISEFVKPIETLLVVDGMSGQDALKSAKIFNDYISISGFIVTKMDSDSRGGVMLSLSYVMKKPIVFLGTGEKVESFEYFYPERIASRVLGMGDLAGLLESVNFNLNKADSNKIIDKVSKDIALDMNDFRDQINQLFKIGGVSVLIEKIPGMYNVLDSVKNKIDDKQFFKMIHVIDSMTIRERKYPNLINGSRKRRIAVGSGTDIQFVNYLLKQFFKVQKLLHKSSNKFNLLNLFKNKLRIFDNK